MKTSTPKKPALPAPSPKSLPPIGHSPLIEVAGIPSVPAKIDTGASYSSIWASDIQMLPSGELEFTLFAPKSPLYTGERLRTRRYRAVRVRNSTGQESIRYSVPLSALTGGVHLHHLRCPDEEAYRRVCQELDRLGVLYTQNGETGD